MLATTLLQCRSITVIDYRCNGGPADEPFVERHAGFSVSYVRKGSFRYGVRGESFELVPGSIVVGYPEDEYTCTHDHVRGDECLAIHVTPELVDAIGNQPNVWRSASVPPLPELMVLGEVAQTAAERQTDVGLRRGRTPLRGAVCRDRFRANATPTAAERSRSAALGRCRALDRYALARGRRSREGLGRSRAQRVSLPANVRRHSGRDAAPVSGTIETSPRRPPPRRGRTTDHRRRVRCRIWRPLEFRADVPPCRRSLAASVPEGERAKRKILQDHRADVL